MTRSICSAALLILALVSNGCQGTPSRSGESPVVSDELSYEIFTWLLNRSDYPEQWPITLKMMGKEPAPAVVSRIESAGYNVVPEWSQDSEGDLIKISKIEPKGKEAHVRASVHSGPMGGVIYFLRVNLSGEGRVRSIEDITPLDTPIS